MNYKKQIIVAKALIGIQKSSCLNENISKEDREECERLTVKRLLIFSYCLHGNEWIG